MWRHPHTMQLITVFKLSKFMTFLGYNSKTKHRKNDLTIFVSEYLIYNKNRYKKEWFTYIYHTKSCWD